MSARSSKRCAATACSNVLDKVHVSRCCAVQAAKVNREKGLSARGSKLALTARTDTLGPRPTSLYMDTISTDIVRGDGPPLPHSLSPGSRVMVPLSAAATAAVRPPPVLLLLCSRLDSFANPTRIGSA